PNARGNVKKIYICLFSAVDALTEQAQFRLMQDIENKTTPTLDQMLSLEKQVWTALVDGNAEADRALLSADFLGVYPSGFANRDDHVGQFADAPTMAKYELSEAKLRVLTSDIVLLSYRADYQRPDAPEWEAMLISSLWERRHDVWINSFSQDTPLDRT
ncbi:MAG: nuclear transport factor 2 family protein, partial [Pseudomonadota bacterium]